jgi:hypothetical protein
MAKETAVDLRDVATRFTGPTQELNHAVPTVTLSTRSGEIFFTPRSVGVWENDTTSHERRFDTPTSGEVLIHVTQGSRDLTISRSPIEASADSPKNRGD